MGKKELAIAFVADGLAIADHGELGRHTQSSGSLPRQPSARCGIRGLDPDEDQARHHTFGQLVHQDLLLGSGRARQERRQVGRKRRAADDEYAAGKQRYPEPDGRASSPFHGGAKR